MASPTVTCSSGYPTASTSMHKRIVLKEGRPGSWMAFSHGGRKQSTGRKIQHRGADLLLRYCVPVNKELNPFISPKAVCTSGTAIWWTTAACVSATSTRRTAGRPIQWTMRERKDWRSSTLSNPVPRFRRRNGNGKNADSQGDRVESLTVPGWAYRKKMTESHRPEWYWQRLSTIRTISVLSVAVSVMSCTK